MAKKEPKAFSYRATDILTTKFAYNDVDESILEILFTEMTNLGFTLNVTPNIDIDNSKFTIDINTILSNKQSEEMLVEHTGRTAFFIEGLKEALNSEKDALNLPKSLLQQMYGIAFSHARALLAVELSPTNFKGRYVLPIVDPAMLVHE